MATIKDLKTLVGDGLLAFEHGFTYPLLRGYKVWGIGTDKNMVYTSEKKIPFDNLTKREINMLYKAICNYLEFINTLKFESFQN